MHMKEETWKTIYIPGTYIHTESDEDINMILK